MALARLTTVLGRPQVTRRLLFAVLAMTLLRAGTSTVVDLDLFHELSLAREIVDAGHVPRADSFSYTPTHRVVVHHEWGAGMIGYAAASLGGKAGILVLKYGLLVALAATVWRTARRRGADVAVTAAVAALAIMLVASSFTTIRAHSYSLLFTALLFAAIDRDRSGDRRWLTFFAVAGFPLWVNLHGGCVVGLLLVGAHWLEQALRRQPHRHILLSGAGMGALLLVNPWGIEYPHYLLRALTMPRPDISEWAPIWHAPSETWPAFVASILAVAAIAQARGFRQIPGILGLAVLAVASVKSHRFLPFYAVGLMSIVPAALHRIPAGQRLRRFWVRRRAVLTPVLILVLLWTMAVAVRGAPWRLRVPGDVQEQAQLDYPVGAVDYLRDRGFRGNVMTPFNWGSYVMWELGPAVQVSMDSRYEVAYPKDVFDRQRDFYRALPGWDSELDRYPTDLVLAQNASRIATLMAREPGWKEVFRDRTARLWQREPATMPPAVRGGKPPDGTFP